MSASRAGSADPVEGTRPVRRWARPQREALTYIITVRLGWFADEIDLILDGATGAVHGWFVAEGGPHPINTDISTVAFAQWLVRQVQLLDPVHDLMQGEAAVIANLVRILGAADPVACRPLSGDGDRRYWPELFDDGCAAGIY
jgi:hypothetical protein